MNNIKKPQSKEWKKIASVWKDILPPSRPSLGDICIYDKFIRQEIKKEKLFKVLILGTTPELRDLLSRYSLLGYNIKVFLLDINSEMIKAMDLLIEIKNKREKKLTGNWVKTSFKDNFFDLIIGDEVMINIKKEKRTDLLKEIFRILSPGGAFILRASHINFQAKKFTVKKSFNKYAKLYFQNKLNLNQVINYLLEEFFELSYFKNKKNLISLKFLEKDFKKELKSLDSEKWLVKKFLKRTKTLLNQYWSWESKSEQTKRFRQYFKIKECKASDDYFYAHILPIYYLKSKKLW